MNDRICVSKQTTYIVLALFFVSLFILLSQLALKSNQANNSRAETTNKNVQQVLPTASPPSDTQQESKFKISINGEGEIQLSPIVVSGLPSPTPYGMQEDKTYSIYMKNTSGEFIHIYTFIPKIEPNKNTPFGYWKLPVGVTITKSDVENNEFYLFQVN